MQNPVTDRARSAEIATARTVPRTLLQLEGAAGLAVAVVTYAGLGGDWLAFALLFFVPDLALFALAAGPRVGSIVYNTVHTYALPLAAVVLGVLLPAPVVTQVAVIWLAHISMDRALGYGLRYATGIKTTHLQRL